MNLPPPPTRGRAPGRLEYLDSLRGLAAVSVLFSHYWYAFREPPILFGFLRLGYLSILRDGFSAVCFFLVLSGYVLSRSVWRSEEPLAFRSFVPAFFARRAARIYPPFWAVLAFAFIGKIWLYHPVKCFPPAGGFLTGMWSDPASVLHFARQALLFDPSLHHLLPHDGTLTSELRCSLLLPFFLVAAGQGSIFLVLLTAVLWISGVDVLIVPFTIGILMARHEKWIVAELGRCRRWIKVLFVFVAWTLYSLKFIDWRFPDLIQSAVDPYLWEINSLGAAGFLALALSSPRLQSVLNGSFLLTVGRVSYSFYLVHLPILVVAGPWIVHGLNALGVREPNTANIVGLIAVFEVTLAASALLYRFVEWPTIRWGHAWSRRIEERRTSGDVSRPAA